MPLIQIELSGVLHPPIPPQPPSVWSLGQVLEHSPSPQVLAALTRLKEQGYTLAVYHDQASHPEVYSAIRAWMNRHGLGNEAIHAAVFPDALLISPRALWYTSDHVLPLLEQTIRMNRDTFSCWWEPDPVRTQPLDPSDLAGEDLAG